MLVAFLGGGEVGALGFLDQRADPIDAAAFVERAGDRILDFGMARVSIFCRPAGFSRNSETSMSPK
jgi:hypothetical protein